MNFIKSAAFLPALIGLAVGLFFNILVNLETTSFTPAPQPTVTKTVPVHEVVIRHSIPQSCVDALTDADSTHELATKRLKAYEQSMDALTDYSWWEARTALKKFKKANTSLSEISSTYSVNQAKCQLETDIANG